MSQRHQIEMQAVQEWIAEGNPNCKDLPSRNDESSAPHESTRRALTGNQIIRARYRATIACARKLIYQMNLREMADAATTDRYFRKITGLLERLDLAKLGYPWSTLIEGLQHLVGQGEYFGVRYDLTRMVRQMKNCLNTWPTSSTTNAANVVLPTASAPLANTTEFLAYTEWAVPPEDNVQKPVGTINTNNHSQTNPQSH